MAERFGEATGSLSDGADRLDRLIRGVKDRQFSEAHNAPAPKTLSNAFAVSPEEAWSKQFMTAGIGPNAFKPVQMPVVSIAAPPPPAAKPAPRELEPAIASPGKVRPTPIGQVLAKPARRRSWFGRLVRGG
ncbi:MAG TPA: hypothetical protein VNU97_14965 [Rhizomicrobium sp.]|jgi:hypothetical protein|nr:hypothetical protein [Rhizomicrobium sp.]